MSNLCPNCGAELGIDLRIIRAPITSKAFRKSARGSFGLTRREGEIADFIVDGLTNRDIAKQLSMSYQVVKNYTQKIYDKVGAQNRTDMVRIVLLGRSGKNDPS